MCRGSCVVADPQRKRRASLHFGLSSSRETRAEWLYDWVTAEALATQTPPALAACVSLGVVSLAASRARIRVLVQEGWIESCNTYTVLALPPANLKSPVFAAGTKPLLDWEREQKTQFGREVAKAQGAHDLLVKRLDEAKRKAAKGGTTEARDVEELAAKLSTQTRPTLPRLFASDITPERLGSLMAEQDGRLAILSAEGGFFETIGGRYSAGVANIDLILNAFSGEPVRVDRGSRDPVHLDDPGLTIVLVVQPDVLDSLTRKPEFRGRGLLGRIAFVVPTSLLGRRTHPSPPVPKAVSELYERRVRELLNLVPTEILRERKAPGTLELRLDDDAQRQMMMLRQVLEPRLGSGGDLEFLGDWAGKFAGLVARIAGLLHVADATHESSVVISGRTFERAARIGEFFLEHARAAFDSMGADLATVGARKVLAWFRAKAKTSATRREMGEGLKGSVALRTVALLKDALEVLVDAGWLRRREPETRHGSGRPESDTYDLNPAATFAKSAEFSAASPSGGESRAGSLPEVAEEEGAGGV
jgi:replicative DNA helicase